MAVFLLRIPETSIESLGKSQISRRSLEVLTTTLGGFRSTSRPWNLEYESLNYENGRNVGSSVARRPSPGSYSQFASQEVRPGGLNPWKVQCARNVVDLLVYLYIYIYMYIYIYIYIYTHYIYIYIYIYTFNILPIKSKVPGPPNPWNNMCMYVCVYIYIYTYIILCKKSL